MARVDGARATAADGAAAHGGAGGVAGRAGRGSNREKSPFYGALQEVVDALFADAATVRRLDVVLMAESVDLPEDLREIVDLLPPGTYTRQRLCDQVNSAIAGHAWGQVYGTVG